MILIISMTETLSFKMTWMNLTLPPKIKSDKSDTHSMELSNSLLTGNEKRLRRPAGTGWGGEGGGRPKKRRKKSQACSDVPLYLRRKPVKDSGVPHLSRLQHMQRTTVCGQCHQFVQSVNTPIGVHRHRNDRNQPQPLFRVKQLH